VEEIVSFVQEINKVYKRLVNSGSILVARWPNAAAGVSITAGATPAFSAWTEIVAAAKIVNPSIVTAVFLENSAAVGAAEVWLVDVAAGASGSEISLSSGTKTAQGVGSSNFFYATAVGTAGPFTGIIPMATGIYVAGAPRITMAVAGLVTGGKAIYGAFQTISGF
jgi:hypothetical protein